MRHFLFPPRPLGSASHFPYSKAPDLSIGGLELMMGVGPMNLVITNDALYQLSYISKHEIL